MNVDHTSSRMKLTNTRFCGRLGENTLNRAQRMCMKDPDEPLNDTLEVPVDIYNVVKQIGLVRRVKFSLLAVLNPYKCLQV